MFKTLKKISVLIIFPFLYQRLQMYDANSGVMKFKEKQSFILLVVSLKSQKGNIALGVHKHIPSHTEPDIYIKTL